MMVRANWVGAEPYIEDVGAALPLSGTLAFGKSVLDPYMWKEAPKI